MDQRYERTYGPVGHEHDAPTGHGLAPQHVGLRVIAERHNMQTQSTEKVACRLSYRVHEREHGGKITTGESSTLCHIHKRGNAVHGVAHVYAVLAHLYELCESRERVEEVTPTRQRIDNGTYSLRTFTLYACGYDGPYVVYRFLTAYAKQLIVAGRSVDTTGLKVPHHTVYVLTAGTAGSPVPCQSYEVHRIHGEADHLSGYGTSAYTFTSIIDEVLCR